MSGYDQLLQRLVKYRQKIGATQEMVSRILHITQSQYSKIELGRVMISHQVLSILKENGWDIDYLITGRMFSKEAGELLGYYEKCGETDKIIVSSLFCLFVNTTGCDFEDEIIAFEWKYFKELVWFEKKDAHPFEIVRSVVSMKQSDMNDVLGVNIKKYRELEKENIRPDAYILCVIYEKFKCRPGIFSEQNDVLKLLLNDIWWSMDEHRRGKAIKFIKTTIQILS